MTRDETNEQRDETVEDLEVQDEQTTDITGGSVSTGGSGGEDRLTENVSLN